MITPGIYAVANVVNGKAYIGSTNNLGKRLDEHRRALRENKHYNKYLQYSWNKYGEGAFEFNILQYVGDLGRLVEFEQFWMDKYREEGKELYNCGLAADCPARGCPQTEEANRKRSETLKGRVFSKETRQRMSASARNRPPISDETRYKLSESHMGYHASKETRRRISKAMRVMCAQKNIGVR